MMRLIQYQCGHERCVAAIEEPRARPLEGFTTVYEMAQAAIAAGGSLNDIVEKSFTNTLLDYEAMCAGKSKLKLLPPVDHPEPARCVVSGTGLTHWGSAKNRDDMHQGAVAQMTDSMKIFQWGKENGKPGAGKIGIAPEWFYKGNGNNLRAHGEPLEVPAFAEDGGEEAEVAGVYVIGPDGSPWRIGMAIGNEFSDHVFERKNYLNLAGSKLRTCAIGPELVIGGEFKSVPGRVRIERGGKEIWAKDIRTGEEEMTHSLENIEHHHFKFAGHRRPGDVHVHFFGAHSLSFGDQVKLQDGDVMEVAFEGFGCALRNPVKVEKGPQEMVKVASFA